MVIQNPTFICIGAQKAGTTWLYHNLKNHEDIYLTPRKEIHYFDELYKSEKTGLLDRITAKEGLNKWLWQQTLIPSFKTAIIQKSPSDFLWFVRYYFFKRNFEWYKKLFVCPEGKISGDITPDYCILDNNTIARIKEAFPNLKIVYIIRNPVERAWSAIKMRYVKRRGYALHDIDSSIVDDYYEKFNEFNDIPRTICNWASFFTDESFKILFYDELVENPSSFLKKIVQHIGAETDWGEGTENDSLSTRIHVGVKAEMPLKIRKILCRKNFDQLVFIRNYFEENADRYPSEWLSHAQNVLKSAG